MFPFLLTKPKKRYEEFLTVNVEVSNQIYLDKKHSPERNDRDMR